MLRSSFQQSPLISVASLAHLLNTLSTAPIEIWCVLPLKIKIGCVSQKTLMLMLVKRYLRQTSSINILFTVSQSSMSKPTSFYRFRFSWIQFPASILACSTLTTSLSWSVALLTTFSMISLAVSCGIIRNISAS